MKYQTALQCFGMLLAVCISLFVAEAVFNYMFERELPKLHHVIPTSTLPYIYNQTTKAGREAAEQARLETEREHRTVTVYLKNNSTMTGRLLSEQNGWIKLQVDGSEVGFHASEITRIDRGEEAEEEAEEAEEKSAKGPDAVR